MSEDRRQFLATLGQPQAPFTVEQTAWALNFQPYKILGLVSLKILTPIGSPASNATKYFFAHEIMDLAKDKTFLKRPTNAMYQSRLTKNRRQKAGQEAASNVGQMVRRTATFENGHLKSLSPAVKIPV
jgi:hypothetical protein